MSAYTEVILLALNEGPSNFSLIKILQLARIADALDCIAAAQDRNGLPPAIVRAPITPEVAKVEVGP